MISTFFGDVCHQVLNYDFLLLKHLMSNIERWKACNVCLGCRFAYLENESVSQIGVCLRWQKLSTADERVVFHSNIKQYSIGHYRHPLDISAGSISNPLAEPVPAIYKTNPCVCLHRDVMRFLYEKDGPLPGNHTSSRASPLETRVLFERKIGIAEGCCLY